MTAPIYWEYQLGGIYFNTAQEPDDLGCLYTMGVPDGWLSPLFRGSSQDIPFADGADVPDAYMGARTIHCTGLITAPDAPTLEQARSRLLAATRLMADDGQFTEQPAFGPARYCTVRRGGQPAFPTRHAPEATAFDFLLIAPDPYKYSVIPHVVPVSSSTVAGGLTFPVTFPVTFATTADVTSSTASSPNAGDLDSPAVLDFNGPLRNPILIDRLNQQRIGLNFAIAAGRTITVDTRAQTILLDGDSVYDALRPESTNLQDFRIPASTGAEWLLLGQGAGTVTVTSWDCFE